MSRIKKLQKKLQGFKLDGFFIYSPENRRYLTGFPSSFGVLLISGTESCLFVDSRYSEAARSAVRNSKVKMFRDYGHLEREFKRFIKRNKIKKLGFEEERLVFSNFKYYSKLIPQIEFIPAEPLIQDLRIIKDSE
ncbi:MAG TPA: hypothetical protein ENN73_00385, partial [Firmicutes bacterium]|nr:hypothetical protein [Bacillota bacterium]